MSALREFGVRSVLVGLAACGAIGPRPDRARADRIPQASLSAAERQRCDAHVERAIDSVMRRRYGDAELSARLALDLDARAARARAVMGMVLLQHACEQDPPDLFALQSAESEIELARELAPDDAFVGWMRAVFFAETGHLSAAATAAEQALARTSTAPPSERAALFGIAGTYRYELGEERAAVPHLQRYVALRPDDATAHFRLGACLLAVAEVPQGVEEYRFRNARRDAEAAAKAFARCFELAPGDDDAALAAAAALVRAAELAEQDSDRVVADARFADVTAYLRELAQRFPGLAEAKFRLGVVAAMQGQHDVARVAYGDALELDPEHPGALMNLGTMAAAEDDEAGARALFTRLLASDAMLGTLSRDERRRIERWLAQRGAAPTRQP